MAVTIINELEVVMEHAQPSAAGARTPLPAVPPAPRPQDLSDITARVEMLRARVEPH
ncbi:MAG: hypothetical protein U0R19_27820 [Bryobacteraceae bacterium]